VIDVSDDRDIAQFLPQPHRINTRDGVAQALISRLREQVSPDPAERMDAIRGPTFG
jgi:hypothetical protein